jgi:glucokinase
MGGVSAGPAPVVLGVDLGATKISAALVRPDGTLLTQRHHRRHSNAGPKEVVAEIAEVIVSIGARARHPIAAVGIGAAAQVDEGRGHVLHAPNLRWKDLALADVVQEATGIPVTVLNDARAATIGEWRHGAGRGVSDLLLIFVGTGVGGSVVSGGRLLEGSTGASGEVGHTVLFAGGRKCHCPGRGCLEAYVGGWAIAERTREAVNAAPLEAIAILREAETVGNLDAEAVGRAAQGGDPLARHLVEETAEWFGQGVAGLVNAYNPARVVLGGGVVEGWPEMVPAVAAAVRSHCQPPAAGAEVRLVELGHNAVLVGAATVARDRLAAAAPS